MTTGETIVLTRWTFVGKVMSLLFKILSRLVITFLPRSKRLLISWLQSPSAVILEPNLSDMQLVCTHSFRILHVSFQIIALPGCMARREIAGSYGDCSHEIKRCLILGRKAMTSLDSILKSIDIASNEVV